MDTVKNIIKRIAYRILRSDLEALHDDLVELKRDAAQARRARASAEHSLSVLQRRLSELRADRRTALAWVSDHSPANLEARALLESIGHEQDSGFGVVHPFARWGITPRP